MYAMANVQMAMDPTRVYHKTKLSARLGKAAPNNKTRLAGANKWSTMCQQSVNNVSAKCLQNICKVPAKCRQGVSRRQQRVNRVSIGCQQGVRNVSPKCQLGLCKVCATYVGTLQSACRVSVNKCQ